MIFILANHPGISGTVTSCRAVPEVLKIVPEIIHVVSTSLTVTGC